MLHATANVTLPKTENLQEKLSLLRNLLHENRTLGLDLRRELEGPSPCGTEGSDAAHSVLTEVDQLCEVLRRTNEDLHVSLTLLGQRIVPECAPSAFQGNPTRR